MGEELASLDAVAQAELVHSGAVSPRELVLAAIARIERLNPTLNAVVSPLFDEALAAVDGGLPDGPFRGVPFLLKDLGAAQAGQPFFAGNRALRDAGFRAPRDTALGRRFRAAGLVTLGKTNVPEFGLQPATQPLAFGPTHNPWDLERSTSGSSGGSCAAVAAGLVPVAHATDAAGSIRLPAAWCGLVGLKPSRGRIPGDPGAVELAHVEFAVARSVRDAAALLDALHGNAPANLFRAEPPQRAFAREVGADPGSLRIGTLASLASAKVHPECARAVDETAGLLEALGHRVEASSPDALHEEERAWRGLATAPLEYRSSLRELARLLGRPVDASDVEPFLWSLAQQPPHRVSAEDWLDALDWRQRWCARVIDWWAGFDLLLTPTLCEPPVPIEELWPQRERPWALLDRTAAHVAFAEPWNETGQPAISLPLHVSAEGLPLGIQLVAAPGREDVLLRVAAQLEEARPWGARRPPLHA
jgi:amidase